MKNVLGYVAGAAALGAVVGAAVPTLGIAAGALFGVMALVIGASFVALGTGGGTA